MFISIRVCLTAGFGIYLHYGVLFRLSLASLFERIFTLLLLGNRRWVLTGFLSRWGLAERMAWF